MNGFQCGPRDAYAIVVPDQYVRSSVFNIPTTHPICQMHGNGEAFHARTKAWTVGVDPNSKTSHLGGFTHTYSNVISKLPSHMRIDVNREQFADQYRHHLKSGLVILKRD